MHRASLVIADRQPVVLCGLLAILNAARDFHVVASCQDGGTCIVAIRDLSPDLALLDTSLRGPSGLQILAAVQAEHLSTRLVYFSASPDPSEAARAMARGAYGVIPKEAEPQLLLDSLREVASGPRLLPRLRSPPRGDHENLLTALTVREREIMHLICEGLSNKEIGRELNLSDGTIKVHLHHIYQKLAIHNRTTLAALAARGERSFERKT